MLIVIILLFVSIICLFMIFLNSNLFKKGLKKNLKINYLIEHEWQKTNNEVIYFLIYKNYDIIV